MLQNFLSFLFLSPVAELLKAQAAGTVVVQGISEDEVEELRKNQEAEVIMI